MSSEPARSVGAAIGDVAGRPTILHYGDVSAEYDALRTGAMMVDRSGYTILRFEGARAAETLSGLVTSDVAALTPGCGQIAVALTPKGKVLADVQILSLDGALLTLTSAPAAPGWMGAIRKFVNPRFARVTDQSEQWRVLAIVGVRAARLLATALDVDAASLAALPRWGHRQFEASGTAGHLVRWPSLGLDGVLVLLAPAAFADTWRRVVSAGATPAGHLAWEIARIEAGTPAWGFDMDDTTIPQEVNLDDIGAISYTKGCYIGQEVVARVHFRGHVNRQLRGLLCGDDMPPPAGATLVSDGGKIVGDVRSSALSPRLGAVALAMVRREIEPGTTLVVRWEGEESRGDVTMLPFPL
ncbi:MAG TPA: glycine cleavage T C-terminal barrel domain-containing protein [Gemmatimonadaceae bacterium]|nr:glycine cleavage T C-terminal barrel domain-containing protein [Gemmatimonadaceae bacterium]